MIQQPILPDMIRLGQRFDVPDPVEPDVEIDRIFKDFNHKVHQLAGARVAVGVGSRGIHRLADVVARTVSNLRSLGADPFIMPAMGSHGGATADGQLGVLRQRGVTEASAGAPMRAAMDVVDLGTTDDGVPVFVNRLAAEADAVCLINRVKPHTNFFGATESGLLKMAAIGLGNQRGAEHYHRLSLARDQYSVIASAGRRVIERTDPFFGLALVENQHHQLCRIRGAFGSEVEAMEAELMTLARRLVPKLPVDEIDLLIVDQMGKDISGEGIDPNVVGRDCCAYGAARPIPRITRIFVRGLTEASEGSALGLGQADFCLTRLVDEIDSAATYVNSLTACCPESARIPIHYPTDVQALASALATVRPYSLDDLGLVYIKNTLDLNQVLVSEAYRDQVSDPERFDILDTGPLRFDAHGMLVSPFEAS